MGYMTWKKRGKTRSGPARRTMPPLTSSRIIHHQQLRHTGEAGIQMVNKFPRQWGCNINLSALRIY
jgi:hypothetical protein